jgi:hypothetical protein
MSELDLIFLLYNLDWVLTLNLNPIKPAHCPPLIMTLSILVDRAIYARVYRAAV